MVYEFILAGITLIGLAIASVTDLKTREVPDWLSYGLICIGLSLNTIFSLTYKNYWFIINSLAGFLIFLIFALIMFYTGQWGGGDSKVIMGLGALIGFDIRLSRFPFMASFLINVLLIGAAYGLLWSIALIFRNFRAFSKEFKKTCNNDRIKKPNFILIIFTSLMVILTLFTKNSPYSFFFMALSLIAITTFYLWIFVKAIEKTCMIKPVTPDKLTEGDWIVKEIKYKGKYICGPKDLGIEKKQIMQLLRLYRQKKIKRVLIKEGIPFVPSFLIAYIVTFYLGNLFFLLV